MGSASTRRDASPPKLSLKVGIGLGQGLYESWVLALRKWGKDPSYDLSDLPPLSVDSFDPRTYQRLLTHLHRAMGEMMEAWSADLQRSLSAASEDYVIARELIRLRGPLARRVQLTAHPGLPAEVSDALSKQTSNDITALQEELEKNVLTAAQGSVSSRARNEQLLAVLRQNRFTAVLDASNKGALPPTKVPQRSNQTERSTGAVRRRIHIAQTPTNE